MQMPKINNIDAVNQALHQEMARDKSVVVLGQDIGVDGGVFRATDGLLKKFGPKRVMDTPLAEAAIIGTSIGMAVNGLKPVAEIQFNGFMYLAMNQLINHMGRIRNRSRGRYQCPMVVRCPHSGGFRALEHHGESMEAIYAHTPGVKVVMPTTPYDTKGLLTAAIRDPDPVIFLEPIRLYRMIKQEVPQKQYIVPIGKAKVVQEGTDVSLITWGTMVPKCKEVAQKSEASVEVIDLRTLSPLDEPSILESVKKTGRAVIVHEAPKSGGLGGEISARINEKIIFDLKAPVLRVTGYDIPYPLLKSEDMYIPSVSQINKAVTEVMKW